MIEFTAKLRERLRPQPPQASDLLPMWRME
jgi:hypothetical protein